MREKRHKNENRGQRKKMSKKKKMMNKRKNRKKQIKEFSKAKFCIDFKKKKEIEI